MGDLVRDKEESGKKMSEKKKNGRAGKRKRQTRTDRVRQRQSICVPCPGKKKRKKRCWVGRLWVPSRDKEQKEEGCRPDQVGAA